MQVPFVDLKTQYRTLQAEMDAAIGAVLKDAAFVGGPHVKRFEESFAAYVGVPHCVGVGNGTDAIQMALEALGIGAGDEVVTAANTFIATAEGISRAGATPVLVDCELDYYHLDPARLEDAITPRTRAVVPVHLYGQAADMDPILEIAGRHGLAVVEDAAQAHGAAYRGRRIGTLGRCACFSFYPGKNLGAYGDAGAVATGDADLAAKVRMLGDHGSRRKYEHEFAGINSRLDGLQAAVLDVKLHHLDAWNERRRQVALRYEAGLKDVVGVPKVRPDTTPVFHLYVVRVPGRERVMEALRAAGIGVGIHYPIPLPWQPAYRHLGLDPKDFPACAAMKDEILSLPMHGDLTDEQVDFVIAQLREAVR